VGAHTAPCLYKIVASPTRERGTEGGGETDGIENIRQRETAWRVTPVRANVAQPCAHDSAAIQSTQELPGWTEAMQAAKEPPASPIDCATTAGGCGPDTKTVLLVPHGATDLRIAGLPFIPAK
jgi:hypothetical protein